MCGYLSFLFKLLNFWLYNRVMIYARFLMAREIFHLSYIMNVCIVAKKNSFPDGISATHPFGDSA